MDKNDLLNDIRGAATIPMDSEVRPISEVADTSLTATAVEQLSSIADRILDEVKETNKLLYELFTTNSLEEKEKSSEEQALRRPGEDTSGLITGLITEVSEMFKGLEDLLKGIAGIQSNPSSKEEGGGLFDFRSLWKGLKNIGKGILRAAPIASVLGAVGMGTKDLYDVFSGNDGGANAKNIGGAMGSVVGAGVGMAVSALLGAATGGLGLAASAGITSAFSMAGNMLGESIGEMIDSNNKTEEKPSSTQKGANAFSFGSRNLFAQAGIDPNNPKAPTSKEAKPFSVAPFNPIEAKINEMSVDKSQVNEGTTQKVDGSKSTSYESGAAMMVAEESKKIMEATPSTPPIAATSESNQMIERSVMVSNDVMAEETESQILPPIMLGDASSSSSSFPNVTASGSFSDLDIGSVPNPNYSGTANRLLAELYV